MEKKGPNIQKNETRSSKETKRNALSKQHYIECIFNYSFQLLYTSGWFFFLATAIDYFIFPSKHQYLFDSLFASTGKEKMSINNLTEIAHSLINIDFVLFAISCFSLFQKKNAYHFATKIVWYWIQFLFICFHFSKYEKNI